MNGQKDYLTITEAAAICSVSRTTMWRWVKVGYVTSCMTLGGRHRIRKVDLNEVLKQNHVYRVRDVETGPEPQFSGHSGSSPPTKILVVDDDPLIRKLMSRFLKSKGYSVDMASNGFQAGAKVMEFNPDLIVLDLFMPGMDGFEVCIQIRENPRTAHIKVLAVSGYDTEENRQRILHAGADAFLPKNVGMDQLIEAVKTTLSGPGAVAASPPAGSCPEQKGKDR